MHTAAAYIRVSTDDQIEFSPDSQLKALIEYAKRNNYILPEEYIFIDEGISGRKAEKRPAFMKMIATAKSRPKPFETILLWKFSRFARNREDSIVYKSMLRKECGVDVISITEQLGEDKTAILIEALLEAMDEYYSINLAEEVKRGMTEKAIRGGVVSTPPFGYDIKDNVFVINSGTATVVKMIFSDYANGKGFRDIAIKLNSMGIVTKRGNKWDNRGVEYLLNNPVYIGKLRWSPQGPTISKRNFFDKDTIISDGKHIPIISIKLWEEVQKRLNENKRKHIKYSRQSIPSKEYLFKGLIRCSNCGATLVQGAKGYFQCHNYAKGICSESHSISFNKITPAIVKQIKTDLTNQNFKINFKVVEDNNNDVILKQIEKEKIKLLRVRQAFENGIDTIEEYKENKISIATRISELENKLIKPSTQKANTEELNKKMAYSITNIDDNSITILEKNILLKDIVEKIVYNKKEQSLYLYYFV